MRVLPSPSSLTGPVIVPLPVKSRMLSSTASTIGLFEELLNLPAPAIESVCTPTFRFPPEYVNVVLAFGMETVALSATLIAPDTVRLAPASSVPSRLRALFKVPVPVRLSVLSAATSVEP